MNQEKLKKIRSVAVYCASHQPHAPEYAEAVIAFGRYLAEHGMTLIYGGSNVGLMKLLAETVLEHGGRVEGVFSAALPEKLKHPNLSECVTTANLAERKAEMLKRADAVVALPGSFGTWDELFDALALRKMKQGHKHPVGILNVNGYYDPLLELIDRSVLLGFTSPGDRNLLKAGKTPEQLFKQLAGSMVPES